jgi:phospholipase C
VYTTNPVEGQLVYENDYNNGKVDGFARNSGLQSMAYFDYHQIAAYWDYAEEYGLGDNYFASVLSTTTPNRLVLFSGDTPVSDNYGPPPYIPYSETILSQLTAHGISWGYFDSLKPSDQAGNLYPINHISGLTAEALTQVHDLSTFFQALSKGAALPSVSFVMTLAETDFDEHPPENVTAGELWTVSVVNAVMKSSYWDSAAIFITWDEGGGYYDHVPPPLNLTIDHGFDRPLHGYGQRVPLLVVSPYAKENYVSRTLLNHMSLLRFIDHNWDLPAVNENVAKSNNLLDFFEFSQPPRPPEILGTSGPFSAWNYPIPIQIPFDQLPYPRTGSWEQGEIPAPSARPIYTIEIATVVVAAFVLLAIAAKMRDRYKFARALSIIVFQPLSS